MKSVNTEANRASMSGNMARRRTTSLRALNIVKEMAMKRKREKNVKMAEGYDAEDEWDSDIEGHGEETNHTASEQQIRPIDRQVIEDVDMLEDDSAPEADVKDLSHALSALEVNASSSSSTSATDSKRITKKGNLYSVQQSLVHPSGLKTVKQKQLPNSKFSEFNAKKIDGKAIKSGSKTDLDFGLSSAQKPMAHSTGKKGVRFHPDPSLIQGSAIHSLEKKRGRAKSLSNMEENSKRRRMDGSASTQSTASYPQSNNDDVGEDSMDWA